MTSVPNLNPDLCSPVLLQQLLRSMESSDTHRSAAITYAMLSLLVRLVASQCSVFNLWFSRRCYERSRGEMITMLYEKTLSRKIIGSPTQPQTDVCPNTVGHSRPSMKAKGLRSRLASIWRRLYKVPGSVFSTTDWSPRDSTRPASMGKILNMMRHASHAVPLSMLRLMLRPAMTSTK